MTWKLKLPAYDGTREIVCDERTKVAELYDEAVQKGLQPSIEDHQGKPVDRSEF